MVRRFGSAPGVLSLAIAMGAFGASTAHAHIKLLKPASWLEENFIGDPQKQGPCGNSGTETNAITTYMAGETITVEWEETIAHPGYFRIAVVENRADLKDPDIVTKNMIDSSCNYPAGAVSSTAVPPVLVDNLFETIEYPTTRGKMSTQVTLPNEPCEKCTLQLIQYMRDHVQPCIYYHCADIKIVAANGGAGNGAAGGSAGGAGGANAGAGGAAGASGASGSAGGSAGMTGSTAGASGSPSGMAPRPPSAGASGATGAAGLTATAGASAGSAAVPPAAPASTADSGCSTSAPRGASHGGLLLGLLLLGWIRLRRRR